MDRVYDYQKVSILIERFNIEVGNIEIMINVDHNNNITKNNDGDRLEGTRIFCSMAIRLNKSVDR